MCYDIRNDRRRTKLHTLLLDFGTPVQYSVFECLVDDEELGVMKKRVRRAIKPRLDHVRYYHLCAACQAKAEAIGGQATAAEEEVFVV